jgi:hypothetical protein
VWFICCDVDLFRGFAVSRIATIWGLRVLGFPFSGFAVSLFLSTAQSLNFSTTKRLKINALTISAISTI